MPFVYPTEFPLQAISTAKQIILAGNWIEQKSRLAKCEAEIQCYAFLLMFGDPDVFGATPSAEQLLPNNDGIRALEELIMACEGSEPSDQNFAAATATEGAEAGFDPATLTLILTIILPLAKQALEWIRNRRNPKPDPAPLTE